MADDDQDLTPNQRKARRPKPWDKPKARATMVDATTPKRRGRKPKSQLQMQRKGRKPGFTLVDATISGSTENLPPVDPPVENGPGAFEFASPNPKNFSDFESIGNNQTSDDQDEKPAKKSPKHVPYHPQYCEIAERAMKVGFTYKELGALLGVSDDVISRWTLKYPEFATAVKMSRGQADDRIERNLYIRACGYEYDAEKPMNVGGEVKIAKYKEHVKPDVVAQIFWLKNRRPELWRDVQQHEHGEAGEFAKMNDEQLLEEIKKASDQLAEMSTKTQH